LHQETLERVRRPPEAPPLSFDGRVIGPQFSTVNTRFHKNAENRQVIGIKRRFLIFSDQAQPEHSFRREIIARNPCRAVHTYRSPSPSS
ncbi:hypothetical protein, partial [Shinella sp. M31]|uniref:hypothetical protein n=1 Tax=Shinella sp. M31 TaxID=3368615 RepID=UPI003BA1162E